MSATSPLPYCLTVDCDDGSSEEFDQVAVFAVICALNGRRNPDFRGPRQEEIVAAFSPEWGDGQLPTERVLTAVAKLLYDGRITHFFGKVGTCSLGHHFKPVKGCELVIRSKES